MRFLTYAKGIDSRAFKPGVYAFGDYSVTSFLETIIKSKKVKSSAIFIVDAKEESKELITKYMKHDIGKSCIVIRNAQALPKDFVKELFSKRTKEKTLIVLSETNHLDKAEKLHGCVVVDCRTFDKEEMEKFLVLTLDIDTLTAEVISDHLGNDLARALNVIRILKSSNIPVTRTNMKVLTEQFYSEDFSMLILKRDFTSVDRFIENYDRSLTVSILNNVFKRLTQLEALVTLENNKESLGWALNQGKISQETVKTMSEFVPSYTIDVVAKAFSAVDQAYECALNPDADALTWLKLSWPS